MAAVDRFIQVSSRVAFSSDKMKKVGLVDTDSLFCDVYCFEPGQEQAGHRHAVGDKLYFVLEGTGHIRVGNEERPANPGDLVCAPAGEDHGVRNPGPGRLTLLVMMAPKPA
jgi:quercetin dioxygenase-like cupin family protein